MTPPAVYVTDHDFSRVVGSAFALGCKGEVVRLPPEKEPKLPVFRHGDSAIYGLLRGCLDVVKFCELTGQNFYHIDHGYFGARDLGGLYRITKNAYQVDPTGRDDDPRRWANLNIKIKPWQKSGDAILVIPPSGFVAVRQGIDPRSWVDLVVAQIRKRTDRKIVVKWAKGGLPSFLPQTHCIVAHESMAALHGLVSGVPAIILGKHCAKSLSWHWDHLTEPDWFDRARVTLLCHALANQQWTLDEMRSGLAWRSLHE